ncbi:MAG: DNA-3-methyladenine glycosylase 2 family protein [Alphaproteobacteria bacterium]|nr:DNA-3-methyladenine glycosylase 2 family protein [Alphaproteobacteria bacterium]
MTPASIRTALDSLAARDDDIAEAIALVGYPEPRNREPGFAALLNIIIGQQVSAIAAAAIRARLAEAVEPLTPEKFLAAGEETLRGVGLSGRKVEYGCGLAEAMLSGVLETDRLAKLPDDEVVRSLTGIRGLGRWSAEIYLLFALRRGDIWPAEDLAIQEALRRLKNLEERPARKISEAIVEPWRPFRGIAALFLWHYYKGAP